MSFTHLLLAVLVLLMPLGQFGRLPLPYPEIRIYLADIVVVALIATWTTNKIRKKGTKFPPLVPSVTLFIGICAASTLIAITRYKAHEVLAGSLYLLRFGAYALLYWIRYDNAGKRSLLPVIAAAGVLTALGGLIQYFLYPNLRNLMYLGWDPHEFRIFGSVLDSGFFGILMVLTLIALNAFFLSDSLGKNTRLLIMAACSITLLSLLLTYSRSSYLAFMTACIVVAFLTKKYWYYAAVAGLFIGSIFFLPTPSLTIGSQPGEGVRLDRTSTIEARGENYQQALRIIRDNPLVGIGFNMMRYENRNRGFVPEYEWQKNNAAAGSDSSLLFVAATTGIVGLLSYLVLAVHVARLELSSKPGLYKITVLPSLAALFVHSLFANSLFYPWCMVWMWILLGERHRAADLGFIPGPVTRRYLYLIFPFRQVK